MVFWIFIFSLAIFDSFYCEKYLSPTVKGEKALFGYLWLFFANYIPLALLDSYQSEISLFLNTSGLSWLENASLSDLLRSLSTWILNFLQYSSILYWISFWASGILSLLLMTWYQFKPKKAKISALLGMLNSFFFLFYSFSAEKSENYILFPIMLGIYLLTFIKIKYEYFSRHEFYDIIEKYNIFIFINAVLTLKRIFYPNLFFDVFYYFIPLYFSNIICYYFVTSYETTFIYFADIWKEFQEKRRASLNFEESDWKICKIYGFLVIFTYFMYISYELFGSLWENFWVLREALFIIGSGSVGYILIYPDGDDSFTFLYQNKSSTISIYCQILAIRTIISIIV
ncbi:unnamed protein product [Blepharisma stoltei]|uniref:Uncharacterized protein n=1 Tax=Blepharisma stoltei TaxID=1481888 RepID=A0AAU9JB58_9CILI|nr:unnamed protein product [Blepharisma stoltei]